MVIMNRDRCTLFLHDIYIKNIQLSTLASTVIKLNQSVIIFPGNVSSEKVTIWETTVSPRKQPMSKTILNTTSARGQKCCV